MERSGERSYSGIILRLLSYSLAIQMEMSAVVKENKKMESLKMGLNGKSRLINCSSVHGQ